MVAKLPNKTLVLPRLNEDYVCYVEEISLIEEDCLWPDIFVYVDDPHSIRDLLTLSSPSSYREGKNLSAYLTSENEANMRLFAKILEEKRAFQTHLQNVSEERTLCQGVYGLVV